MISLTPEQFYVANEITGDAKAVKGQATFLSIVGRSTYNRLLSLIAPAKPTDKMCEELVKVLTVHYSPKPTEVMQCYRFNSGKKQEGETIVNYVTELKRLAEFGNYGDTLN